jgi:hypothetical protein
VHVPSLTRAVGRYGCIGFCSHFWVFIKSVGRRVASSGHHSLSHLDGNERCGRAVHDQGGAPHRCIVHVLFLPFFRARLDVHNTKQKRPRARKADTCSKTVPLTFHFCILPEKIVFTVLYRPPPLSTSQLQHCPTPGTLNEVFSFQRPVSERKRRLTALAHI